MVKTSGVVGSLNQLKFIPVSSFSPQVSVRTSERLLTTLRGSILEDAVPSTSKHGLARGLPLKEVLDYLVPELNAHCLRLALNTPKVTEQLMKLDEQGLSFQLKVGVMYCASGQSSEEDMYNNDSAGPALEEFLQLLGERVRLKGFTKYRAQLDTKTDSTGTHSLYTTYKDYEVMFHVSTMLPYTPNNKQQLLRKRHIGNDIVTIVFQEPGAQPFTPKNIRSHFQHVFVVVRAHQPCSDNTSYSVAVTRSRDVPSFGPPIPEDVSFPKSSVFRDFLLAKIINAENAAHKSHKFRAMATRTRQEYLRDLAERHTTSTPIDPSGKFPFISLAHKRKEKSRPYAGAELRSLGAVTWAVHAEDHGAGGELEALLAISNDFLILLDQEAKAVVFNCATKDVIGWTLGSPASMRIFYERGESVSLRSVSNNTEDFREVVKRLEYLTKGCETSEMTLRRNGLGQLGFHVNYEGIVAEVESYGYAWQAGLRQGSRLVEICKVAVATLTHEQMIDLLRTSVTVRVVIIPPHEDATPRRGCSELYRMPVVEYKGSGESGSFDYKFPFRSKDNKWQRTSSSPQQSLTASPQPHTPNRAVSLGSSGGKTLSAERPERNAAIPRSVSSDGRPLDTKRMSPGSENYAVTSSLALGRSPHNRSSPSNLSCSTDTSQHWRTQKSMPEGFGERRQHSPLSTERQVVGEGGASGKSTPNWPRVEEGGGKKRQAAIVSILSYHLGVLHADVDIGSVDISVSQLQSSSCPPTALPPNSPPPHPTPPTAPPTHYEVYVHIGVAGLTSLTLFPPSLAPSLQSSSGQPPTRRSLHRTLSDESIYRGQRVPSLRLGDLEPDPSLASDVLFSCSTLPRSPTTRGVPLRRPSYKLGIKLHGDLSASDTSLAEMVERQRHPLPQELMPLPPSESRDSPLDWTHLVDVASTFEIQRGFVFSDSNPRGSGASSPHQSQPSLEIQLGPLSRPSSR
uniref:Signal-induced proliferation-associated 1 like 1 n=1 Tax=Oncorhynchus kisutch TaxID=8019 RepID=A0A8C7MQW7_ONCKI